MGEHAELALVEGFDSYEPLERGVRAWGSGPGIGRTTCRRCGKGALHWRKIEGQWRLHHYTMFGSMREPGYVLHRCGFQSDGTPVRLPPKSEEQSNG